MMGKIAILSNIYHILKENSLVPSVIGVKLRV
jgi:hypothetical protein